MFEATNASTVFSLRFPAILVDACAPVTKVGRPRA
jgi:hypothetical protein